MVRTKGQTMVAQAMQAMVLDAPGRALRLLTRPVPAPGPGQVLIEVGACAVCRTDLHVVDGELPEAKLPIVPGHEIVGRVAAAGSDVDRFRPGERVGIPWLGWTCGTCRYCRAGQENLCERARFTGYQIDGGYCFPIPEQYSDAEAAPLLCAGLIGYRALQMAGDGATLGIFGFGAAAHIVAQVVRHRGRRLFAFTRPGDGPAQAFARRLGAEWAGGSDEQPPELLDAAIIFAPAGALVPAALRAIRPGGTVVCGGIHMSEIPAFPYDILWREKRLVSVANLTRDDGLGFLALAPRVPVRTEIETFPLQAANDALDRLRRGALSGAAVLVMPAASASAVG
jgi:propanol-preferring alcohol dehydrogenase